MRFEYSTLRTRDRDDCLAINEANGREHGARRRDILKPRIAADAASHPRVPREQRAAWTVGNALAVEFLTKTRPLAATS